MDKMDTICECGNTYGRDCRCGRGVYHVPYWRERTGHRGPVISGGHRGYRIRLSAADADYEMQQARGLS